ncbi:MAG: 1-deoxy-D-xylulose-5-phosphate reductoisomerase [Solirubrobacterales bacterium]
MKKIAILGSTGSIGLQAMEIAMSNEGLDVVGLSVESNWRKAVIQARESGAGTIAVSDPAAALDARAEFEGTVLEGESAARDLIEASGPDIVLNGIVGAVGLGPTIATLNAGIDLALANKESLVIGGELVIELARATGSRILPVDSEHSAIFQLLDGESRDAVERIVLTASGGPFRGRTDLASVTVAEALDHPTWKMGGRITIDSATLMNKGFEMIEAHHLFGVGYEMIDVVIHPQSIVHSLVNLVDGSTLAHLGYPDMRVPIAFALAWPERIPTPVRRLDLATVSSLDFEEADLKTFRCLDIARRAGIAGGISPCVMNAADEIAVQAFLDGRVGFPDIAALTERVLDDIGTGSPRDFRELFAIDEAARERTEELVLGLGRR